MDDFSKTILKELLPSGKLPRAPKAKRKAEEGALDHLAAPILLERAAHLPKLARFSDGSASEVLKEYPQHAIHLLVRSRNGGAELHERFADLFFVIEGRAALLTGGVIPDAKTIGAAKCAAHRLKAAYGRNCVQETSRTCPLDCPIRCWFQATNSSPASWSRSSRIRRSHDREAGLL